MDLASFLQSGERLAEDLLAASERYHVRSDQRDILAYESATVRAYLAFFATGTAVPDNLRTSVLLGDWGASFQWPEAGLLERTFAFHEELRRRDLV